jgi:hypothetical protein
LITVYETKIAEAESVSSVTEIDNAMMHIHSPLLDLVLGCPRIAGRMSLKPETAIFGSFNALNARISCTYKQTYVD